MLSTTERPKFPFTSIGREKIVPSEEKVMVVTEAQVQKMIDAAITQHNRNAGLISMVLGFTFLGLFGEGFFRMIGIIPPFMGIDIQIIPEIADKVKEQILPLIT